MNKRRFFSTCIVAAACLTALILVLRWFGGSGGDLPRDGVEASEEAEPLSPRRGHRQGRLRTSEIREGAHEPGRANSVEAMPAATTPDREGVGSLMVMTFWGDGNDEIAPNLECWVKVRSAPSFGAYRHFFMTDSSGKFLVDDVPIGRVVIEAALGGFANVIVTPGTSRVELHVPVGISVTGSVVDEGGRPVPSAAVWVSARGGTGWGREAVRTGHDGRFQLRSVPPGRHIGAWKAGWSPSDLTRVVGKPGDMFEANLLLSGRGASIVGVALDARGNGVVNAVVAFGSKRITSYATRDGGYRIPAQAREAETSSDGRFELHGLPEGTYPLTIEARGYAPWKRTVQTAASEVQSFVAHLSEGGILLGTVFNRSGIPLRDVRVRTADRSRVVLTDAEGRYRMGGLAVGENVIVFGDDTNGRTQREVTILEAQESRCDIVLEAGASIQGHVVCRGVPMARIMVTAELHSNARARQTVTTKEDGSFCIAGCIPGDSYFIRLAKDLAGPALAVVPHAQPDETRHEFDIEQLASHSAFISGIIVDSSGSPVSVKIEALRSRGFPEACMSEPGTGRFCLGPLGPFEYRVRADGKSLTNRRVRSGERADVGILRLTSD